MLSISNVTPNQGANYFKIENYYSKEEAQEQSSWFGQGAEALGLSGSVNGEQFKNLLEGYSPDGKKALSGKKINLENRRAGFDLTFSAPKSVSLAILMGGAKDLEQAHCTAVERTLRVVEQQYAQARVWDGKEQQKVNTGNIVVAQFHHTTSREKDPQRHTHCVVLNCTQLENGKWRALTNEELYNNEMLLGAIYRNELASEARKLGYEIETRPDGLFEIKGYSETQLKWFSKRRQQILELVGEHATAKEKQWAALQTRAAKGKELPREEQLGWWQAQDEAFNLQIQHPVPKVDIQPISDNIAIPDSSAAAAVTAAIEHCSEKTVAFKRKALEKFIFSEIKSFSYAELESAIASSTAPWAIANDPELMATFDGRFTTQAAVNRELETIRLMQQGKDTVDSIADSETVKLRLENKTLTRGQQDAIALATTTTDGFIAWQGVAGAGKTYVVNEFKIIAAEQGYTIKGFAPSSEAAAVLGDEVGIESNTIASLLVSKQNENIEDKQIWIVDEAGLLSAKDAHDLLKLATNQKARVILVGDTKQLSAVEAGNPFKSLQSAGISTAYLNQSLRQRVKDLQESVDLVAAGKIEQGMERLNAANRIAVIPDAEERLVQLMQDYMALSPEERDKTLVLAGTNSDRQLIINSIRQELKAEGVLGKARSLTGLKAKDLSQVQTRYSHYYAVGDVVVPTREYKRLGLTKFQPYTVETLEKNSLTLVATDGTRCTVDPMAFRKAVYEQQSVEVAVGDFLKWTRNDRELGRRNGQQFVVTAINGNLAQIQYAKGKTDEVDLNQLQHLDYALVSTTYSSQGKTADRVMIAADKTMGKESFYVAVSRAKYDLKIYTEDKSDLLKLARKSKAKEIAIELIGSKPVAKQAATTEQSISTTQLPATNEELTYERTDEPAQPALDTEQFSLDDIEQRFVRLERAGHRQTGNNISHSTTERVSWAVKVEQQPIERISRQLLNATSSSVASEAIANYIDQTAVEAGINQTVATLTEQIAQQTTGLSDAMTQLDTVISDRLQKLDALKTNLEKERSDRATEALSNYVDSSAVESALGETVSSLVGQFSHYRQQLATGKIALKSCEQLINRLTADRAISAIAGHVEFEAIDNSKLIPALESLILQLSQNKEPFTIALAQFDTVVSKYLTELKTTGKVLEQRRNEQTISAISNYIGHEAVNWAIVESVSSLVEQFSQYQHQLVRDKTNSYLNALLNRLGSISNLDAKAKLHPKDLHEVETGVETRSPSTSANQSPGGKLPERNEAQWAQVRRYLVEKRCLPTQLVDRLATAGKVYADSSGNAVFLHTASQGRITGATVFDVKSEVFNCQLAPSADNGTGYFQLSQGKDKLSRIVLTDSPIEAISLAALERGQYKNRTLYIDVSERQNHPELQSLLNNGVGIEVAFSIEGASETRARQIVDSFPGAIRSNPAQGKSWNEQLRSKSKSKNNKPVEKKRLLPALRSAQSQAQKFDPHQHLLQAIQVDRARYRSACQADLKTAINGLVAGHSLEQIGRDITSSSSLVKYWQKREVPSTLATAKTIQYVEQLLLEAQASPLYYQQLYHKYLKDMQRTHGHLPRAELDRMVASAALKFHPVSSVKSILKYSLAAQVGDGEYIPQILAEVRRQEQSVQEPQQHEKTKTYKPRGFEFGD
jgi:conjugative relaxase-like TrwC/TraI family protein